MADVRGAGICRAWEMPVQVVVEEIPVNGDLLFELGASGCCPVQRRELVVLLGRLGWHDVGGDVWRIPPGIDPDEAILHLSEGIVPRPLGPGAPAGGRLPVFGRDRRRGSDVWVIRCAATGPSGNSPTGRAAGTERTLANL